MLNLFINKALININIYDYIKSRNFINSYRVISSAFSKTNLNIWKFMIHVLLKSALENFEHYFTRVWDECNCAVVWAFFGIAFLQNWNENWPFSSPVVTAEFSKFANTLSAALSQHHLLRSEIAQLEFHHLH